MYNLKLKQGGKILNMTLPQTDDTECFILTDSSGLTGNAVDITSSQTYGQIGTTIQGMAVQGRQIILTGTIWGNATRLRRLMQDVLIPEVDITVIFDNWLYTVAWVTSGPEIDRKPANADFQVTLYAPDPYWYTLEMHKSIIAGIIPKFKFPINYYDPETHRFGVSAGGEWTNAENKGNVPAPFKLIFKARQELENPSIILLEQPVSSKTIKFIDTVMLPGDVITVDMINPSPTATLTRAKQDTSVFSYLDIDTTFFRLQPGDNPIRYDADRNRGGLYVDIISPTAYAGAFGDDVTYL